MSHWEDNIRIAKNTMFLYFRMLLIMLVTFYSFRVLLAQLGEIGYGTYNAVAGVVILFSFLSSAMRQATQRYISYYIGKKDIDMLGKVFSISINIHIKICLILLLLAETIGLWFLNKYMKFPVELHNSVLVLYQVSVISFLVQLMTIPYQGIIISHERMSFYAYFSIVEAGLKLAAVLVLSFSDSNKLVIYGIAILGVSIIVWIIYFVYTRNQFPYYKYRYYNDKKLSKELMSFSGWNLLGGVGTVAASQGVNIIFNIFCGVVINAAMGIANQISAAVTSFVSNFQLAFSPQLIKSYAAGDRSYLILLFFRTSRISFLLTFCIGLPLILFAPTVLDIWLTDYPKITIPFVRWMIVFCIIESLSGPLWTIAQARGRIKGYMIVISLLVLSNIPAALFLLMNSISPVVVIAYKAFASCIIYLYRLCFLKTTIQFSIIEYFKDVVIRILLYISLITPVPIVFCRFDSSIFIRILFIILVFLLSAVMGYFMLLHRSERKAITKRFYQYFKNCA